MAFLVFDNDVTFTWQAKMYNHTVHTSYG